MEQTKTILRNLDPALPPCSLTECWELRTMDMDEPIAFEPSFYHLLGRESHGMVFTTTWFPRPHPWPVAGGRPEAGSGTASHHAVMYVHGTTPDRMRRMFYENMIRPAAWRPENHDYPSFGCYAQATPTACNPDTLGQLLQNFTIGKSQLGAIAFEELRSVNQHKILESGGSHEDQHNVRRRFACRRGKKWCIPMLQRQNYPQQPSPAASNHHGNMYDSTAPRPPSPFHRLSPPSSRRRPFSPSSPGPVTRGPLFSPPSTASKATPPPVLRPLHSVPTPAEFNPDDDHYDTTRVAGYDLPKVITHTALRDRTSLAFPSSTSCTNSGTAGGYATSPMEVRYASLSQSRCRSQSSPLGYSAKSDNDILTWMPSLFTSLHRRAPRPPNQQP